MESKVYKVNLEINNGTSQFPVKYNMKTEMPFSIAELSAICQKAIEKADKLRKQNGH
jgi:hypothetical protein